LNSGGQISRSIACVRERQNLDFAPDGLPAV
jgi:hypothetical protein